MASVLHPFAGTINVVDFTAKRKGEIHDLCALRRGHFGVAVMAKPAPIFCYRSVTHGLICSKAVSRNLLMLMARETGLEPATSGVTDHAIIVTA